ncbi:MAG: hypothetical protein MUF58_14820 [Arcicella sp.]|nr:hypothetical protein [Arcicella sp.]
MLHDKEILLSTVVNELRDTFSNEYNIDITLYNGFVSSLVNISLYDVTEQEAYLQQCKKIIDKVLPQTIRSTEKVSPIVLTGIGFIEQFLIDKGVSKNQLLLNQLDEKLFKKAETLIRSRLIDIECGVQCIFHYFSCNPTQEHLFCLERLKDELLKILTIDNLGCRVINEGKADLTMPFGWAGLLMPLLKFFKEESPSVTGIINGGIKYFMSYKGDVDFSENLFDFFPDKVIDENKEPLFSNQMSWAFGDLSKALLFYQYGQLSNNSEYTNLAHFIGLNTLTRREPHQHNVTRPTLLYGSSGIALIYQQLYQFTNMDAYQKGKLFWINKTQQFLEQKSPLISNAPNDDDVLNGTLGVKLALLSCYSSKQLTWEKLYGMAL